MPFFKGYETMVVTMKGLPLGECPDCGTKFMGIATLAMVHIISHQEGRIAGLQKQRADCLLL